MTTDYNELQQKLQYQERLNYVTNIINAANNCDEILLKLKDEILLLFEAVNITIYGVDPLKNELYSRHMIGPDIKEIRVPVSPASLAGYAAYSLESINIHDVYDEMELKKINHNLKFDVRWDKQSGFRTKQVLASPIRFENRLFGVIQLINTKDDQPFHERDLKNVQEISRVLGIAFRNQSRVLNTRFNYLISHNLISMGELKKAMTIARDKKKDIETILMKELKVKKRDIGAALAHFYGCRFMEYNERHIIPKELCKGINLTYLKRMFWVPVGMSEDKIIILIDNPNDLKTAEIKSLIKAKDYEFRVALREDILKYIQSLDREEEDKGASISDILGELDIKEEASDNEIGEGDLDENTGAIVRLVNQIIIDAYNKGASDIHIEPNKSRKSVDIRIRTDGVCAKYQEVPYSHSSALVSRIKIMSNLDISEKRLPQDGKIKFLFKGRPIELRVATLPTVGGEDVVMRVLASSEPMPVEALNLSERNYNEFKRIISVPYGIFLVVGPTGSGKTTTLHSAMGYINTPDRKIWTAEDPVEITQYGLRQVEVKPKINFDFARAMRSFLRADPDVIMVGEMRDHETASTGIEASLTGHLVMSTLHTNSAPETITRLIDMNIDPFNFADALLGVLAQRLVRTLCKSCKEPYRPSREEFDNLVSEYGTEYFPELGIELSDKLILYKAKGCDICNETGYRGRTGLHELLAGTDEIKEIVQKRSTVEEIRKVAIQNGMRTLYQDGIAKILQGITDITQVRRVCIV